MAIRVFLVKLCCLFSVPLFSYIWRANPLDQYNSVNLVSKNWIPTSFVVAVVEQAQKNDAMPVNLPGRR